MDDLEYIEYLETKELIRIIENILGFEETSKAMCELSERDENKTLELGIEIIEESKGDDYLQGFVFGLIFDINPRESLKCIDKRKKPIGAILLRDVMEEVLINYSSLYMDLFTTELLNDLLKRYHQLDYHDQERMQIEYIKLKNKIVLNDDPINKF